MEVKDTGNGIQIAMLGVVLALAFAASTLSLRGIKIEIGRIADALEERGR